MHLSNGSGCPMDVKCQGMNDFIEMLFLIDDIQILSVCMSVGIVYLSFIEMLLLTTILQDFRREV